MITLHTNVGDISLTLDFVNTPNTAQNFLNYAKNGFYNGTIFHRVIKNFMIQGGGFNDKMQQKPTEKNIKNEADKGAKNKKYTVAMARTSDPHSASSQFFINVVDNDFLNFKNTSTDWGYCVFAHVTAGTEVVDQIAKVATGRSGHHDDVPVTPVLIDKVTVTDEN